MVWILAVSSQAAPAPEMRAFYIPTFNTNTQAKCDAVIADAVERNVNAVFVQIRARGDAYFVPNREDATYPNPEPRGQLYTISPSDLDILQCYIDRLHAASPRIEVHAWLTTYNTWNRSVPPPSPAHVLNAHPEWVTESEAGVTFTTDDDAPLDPGVPAVNQYLYNIFMDVVRNYDIDGIHFDYIRLLGADSGYDPVAKAQFLADTGWNYDTQNAAGQLTEVYKAWRRDRIAQLVQRVHAQTMLEKPWVEVSAFLVNFTDSVENLGQGYNWWVHHAAIDLLVPGCYSSTVAGTESDWHSYVSKLAQGGDETARPMVCAVGSYLFVDPDTLAADPLAWQRNEQTVNTLRSDSRVPDGFNFFAWRALFSEGDVSPPDLLADELFDPGGPMDTSVPLPTVVHKIPLGEETTPPNPPAALSASIVGGAPRITFSRPAAAADGDLPVRYRLHRDTDSPVDLFFDNMVMEWWDLDSGRSSFTFDDVTAPAGTLHYAAVAHDDWNNEAVTATGPVTHTSTAAEHIIETRAGGKNVGDYTEVAGTWSNSTSHSTAPGTTAGIGSRFALPGDANGRNDRSRFTPSGLVTGNYDVHVTCFNFSSANAQNITVRLSDADGISSTLYDLTAANAGNVWDLVANIDLVAGQGHFIEFDNSTQTNIGDSTNSRMNPAAVRFVRTDLTPTPKEPKPPVSAPPSTVTEVIADSHPQALDYDDRGGTGGWATTTFSPSGTLFNGNARFHSAANFPVEDYAVWVADLPRAGRWAIDGWIRAEQTSLAQGAQYRFVDGLGTVHSVTATQQTGSTGWTIDVDGVTDEEAHFFHAGRVFVTLYRNTMGAQLLLADALRFRLIEDVPAGLVLTGRP
jgi:uncharacterized lipoprotein YddW (UPF0748 family)